MRSFAAVLAVAGVAVAHGPGGWPASAGWGAPSYVTDVVTAYTTYCPEATHITHGSKTYTVTEATTLTISDCPCTVTRPVASSVSTSSICTAPAPKPPVASSSAGPAPVPVVSASTSYSMPAPSASATTSAPASTYTGAASKVQVAGGLLAALGLVAAAL